MGKTTCVPLTLTDATRKSRTVVSELKHSQRGVCIRPGIATHGGVSGLLKHSHGDGVRDTPFMRRSLNR